MYLCQYFSDVLPLMYVFPYYYSALMALHTVLHMDTVFVAVALMLMTSLGPSPGLGRHSYQHSHHNTNTTPSQSGTSNTSEYLKIHNSAENKIIPAILSVHCALATNTDQRTSASSAASSTPATTVSTLKPVIPASIAPVSGSSLLPLIL